MEKLQEIFRRPTARLAAVFIVILAAGLLLLWFAAGVPEFCLGQILAGAIAAIFAATGLLLLLCHYLDSADRAKE